MARPLRYADWIRLNEQGMAVSGAWFLCGPESLLRDRIISQIRESAFDGEDEARAGHDRFYGGEGPLTAVTSALASVGLFSGTRLVTLSEPEKFGRAGSAERAELLRMLASEMVGSIFVASSDLAPWELERKNEFTRGLLRVCRVIELAHPSPAEAMRWLLGESRRRGISLDAEGGEYLVGRTGPDLQELSRELEKLEICTRPGERVGRDLLQDLAGRGTIGTGTGFVDALVAFRAPEALRLLGSLGRTEPVLRLQWLIQRKCRDRLARTVSHDEDIRVRQLLHLMHELERSIKQGRIPSGKDGTALEVAVAATGTGPARTRARQ